MCYQLEANGGHAKHVETGQLVQDAHPTLLEVLMKSVLTVEGAPCSVKLTKILPHLVGIAPDRITGHLVARQAPLPPSRASRGSNPIPTGKPRLKPEPQWQCRLRSLVCV